MRLLTSGAGEYSLSKVLTNSYKSDILIVELVTGLDKVGVIPNCPPAGSGFKDIINRAGGFNKSLTCSAVCGVFYFSVVMYNLIKLKHILISSKISGDYMKKQNDLWELVGFAVTSFGGTILHFLYDWTGGSIFVAPFSGVNESTWEHMKLLFWPMFIFAILQSFFFRDREDYWCIKLKSIAIGLSLIPIIFYTYNGVIGKSPDWLNISIFFIAAAAVYIYETILFNRMKTICRSPKFKLIILCIIAVLFIVFTFKTPELNVFKDPLTGKYGI